MTDKIKEFRKKMTAELEADIAILQNMQSECDMLIERNTESSTGGCILDSVKILLRDSLSYYEAEKAMVKAGR